MTPRQALSKSPPTRPVQARLVVQRWSSFATRQACHSVVPDGCRDLIIRRHPGKRPVWFVSDLADATLQVALEPGLSHQGFRLCPGARIDQAGLLASMHGDLDDTGIDERLQRYVTAPPQISEALAALSAGTGPGGRVALVAARLGVQARTLQRLVTGETGRAPVFWMRLARVRQGAAQVALSGSLGELAHDCGFADQAHMTREMRHWLGVTPRQIRLDPGWAARHLGVGYGV